MVRPALSAVDVAATARRAKRLADLDTALIDCRACPRLVEWRERIAAQKRRAFATETYWGRPVPGFGDPRARLLVVGLAPAAHGANRTGRMFTGDRSGDWLYAALHRAGFASQPTSRHLGDGLSLRDTYVTAPVHCAPPANTPTPAERHTCAGWFDRELDLLWPRLRVVVALGRIGWDALWSALRSREPTVAATRPTFGHGAEGRFGTRAVLASYHVSQQNTFTGRLTEAMLDDVVGRAAQLARAD